MVVLMGPHKSASSSVQELFLKYASGQSLDHPAFPQAHHPSLEDWIWPYIIRRRSYLPRKGFAPLVTEEIGFHKLIWKTMWNDWNSNITGHNMVWGSEELDRFGVAPWSHRNGIQAIQQVIDRMPPSQLDLVVNYRQPRQDQWISIWKQLYRKQDSSTESSYSNFMCDPMEALRIWEYLDCVANPLGLVQAVLSEITPPTKNTTTTTTTMTRIVVHLMDMQGIESMDRDVGHVIACDVLKVPCTDNHWLPQIEHPIVKNRRSRPSGLTEAQLQDMEWVLQQRDCSYRQELDHAVKNGKLQLHYGDHLWDSCPEDDESLSQVTLSHYQNTTWLMDLLQSQVGCGSSSMSFESTIGDLRRQRQGGMSSKGIDTTLNTKRYGVSLGGRSSLPHHHKTNALNNPHQPPEEHQMIIHQTATAQIFVLYLLLLACVATILRRIKWRHLKPHQRRLVGRRHVAATKR